jgi:hypothetical protein
VDRALGRNADVAVLVDHEDNEMMRPWIPSPAAGNSDPGALGALKGFSGKILQLRQLTGGPEAGQSDRGLPICTTDGVVYIRDDDQPLATNSQPS